MDTTPSVTPGSTAVGAGFMNSILNSIGGPKGGIPLFVLVAGIIAIIVGSMASPTTSDQAVKVLLGGIGAFLAGGVGLLYTSGKGKPIIDWFSGINQGQNSTSTWALTAVVLLIVFAIFTAFFYSYSPSEALSFTTVVTIVVLVMASIGLIYSFAEKDTLSNATSRFAFSLYFFMPYALFTFGFIHDAIMKKLLYIPASFAGLTGMLFNYALTVMNATSTANTQGMPVVTNSLCEIPGLSQLSSSFAPQSMMFTLSILSYIATYISRSHIGGVTGFTVGYEYRWPAWALFASVYLFHIFVLFGTGCIDRSKALWGLFLPLGWGGLLGFLGFSNLERSDRNTPPSPGGGDSLNGPAPKSEISEGKCSATAQDGEFTCETFKNGKLETSIITE